MDVDGYAKVPIACQTCIGAGELIMIGGGTLTRGTCSRCKGNGRFIMVCAAEQVVEVTKATGDAIMRRRNEQLEAILKGARICRSCFGSGLLTWIERDEAYRPVEFAEALCSACEAPPGASTES